MNKLEFKGICRIYGIKKKALKECLKKENIELKSATKRDVLNTIFVYAPELMFSRSIGGDAVEYHYPDLTQKLIDDLSEANQGSNDELISNEPKKKILTTYDKWEELQEHYYKEGYGEIFNPVAMYKEFKMELFENLQFKEDYEVDTSVTFGITMQPELEIKFTKKGIKKLLQSNQKMIDEVENLWADYCEEVQQ